jgi:hypothetical protein
MTTLENVLKGECLCLENKMVMDLVGLGSGQSVEGAASHSMPKLNVFMVG